MRWVRQNRKYHSSILLCALFLLMTAGLSGCDKETKAPDLKPMPDSFSFFDVTVNTPYNGSLRSSLKSKLGKDAVAKHIPVDLETNYQGFIKKNFPKIERLNNELNGKYGVRVEQNVIQLAFRYINDQAVPFSTVELLFSGWTKRPILTRIFSRRDGKEVLAALIKKYGEARSFNWGEGSSEKTYYWEKHGDLLVFSERHNPAGRKEFEIVIYYVKSIRNLLQKGKEGQASGGDAENGSLKNIF